jgi:histone H1/5
MAKAKKQEATDAGSKQPAAAKPAAAKAAAPKAAAPKAAATKATAKKPAKTAKSSAPAGAPMIDTSLAAAAAAQMVGNRNLHQETAGQEGKKPESAAFRQMKENLNKPSGAGSAGLQHNAGISKKMPQPFGGFKQVGRNQTFGADVNRAGVPRRTGG